LGVKRPIRKYVTNIQLKYQLDGAHVFGMPWCPKMNLHKDYEALFIPISDFKQRRMSCRSVIKEQRLITNAIKAKKRLGRVIVDKQVILAAAGNICLEKSQKRLWRPLKAKNYLGIKAFAIH